MSSDTSGIEFESTNCMLCGAENTVRAGETGWRGNVLSYVLCQACGLKFMNPRPTRRWYARFYTEEFWQDKFENKSWREDVKEGWLWKFTKGGLSGRLTKGTKRARLVVPAILAKSALNSRSRVLDVGCSFGLVLREIRKGTGASIFGIEPNEAARSYAEKKSKVTFIGKVAEDLMTLEGYDGAFSLICFSNVLENIVHPQPILSACRRLLSDDGVLYIDSPNMYYYDAMNPYHPYVYSAESLTNLLESCGFELQNRIYEDPIGDESMLTAPFKVSRPRFLTFFARKGTVKSIATTGIDAASMMKRIELSSRRWRRSQGGVASDADDGEQDLQARLADKT